MTLRIIATGGTFDKHYTELNGVLGFAESHLPEVIARSRMTIPVELQVVSLLDSLEMQDSDRQNVLAACQAAELAGAVEQLAPAGRAVFQFVRTRVPFLALDRYMTDDIEAVAALLRDGALLDVVRQAGIELV